MKNYPNQYLHVECCKSGEEWIMPIGNREFLDLEKLVKKWIKNEFGGELRLDGKLQPRLQGDYYGKIITDGREPHCGIVWNSGGFYLKN
jgi:hypothetical protein